MDKNTLKEKWHLDGPFEYALEARPGTAFGNACTGGFLQPTDNADYKLSVSSHGHMPEKGPQPTFFMAGPQVKTGVIREEGRLIDEGPTWAAVLGVEMPKAQGQAFMELLV